MDFLKQKKKGSRIPDEGKLLFFILVFFLTRLDAYSLTEHTNI